MGSNTEKKLRTNLKTYTKIEAKCDNFCYCKVGRAITKWGAIEKSYHFETVPKIISHLDGSNNIFADCRISSASDSICYMKGVPKRK